MRLIPGFVSEVEARMGTDAKGELGWRWLVRKIAHCAIVVIGAHSELAGRSGVDVVTSPHVDVIAGGQWICLGDVIEWAALLNLTRRSHHHRRCRKGQMMCAPRADPQNRHAR
jgi:hypothetical protein